MQGVLRYLEVEPLGEPHGPYEPRRVFDEAQVMQNADGFFLYVPFRSEKIYQFSEAAGVQGHGEGIYGKVPSV